MGSVKLEKLAKRIKERSSEILLHEMNDPRFGFVTVTRVKLSRDLKHCLVFYSVLGSEADRSKIAKALDHARGFIQKKVAAVLHTRSTPHLAFRYDESVEGSIRVSRLIDEITRERNDEEAERLEQDEPDAEPREGLEDDV
jgi:ribosome-binding factor A